MNVRVHQVSIARPSDEQTARDLSKLMVKHPKSVLRCMQSNILWTSPLNAAWGSHPGPNPRLPQHCRAAHPNVQRRTDEPGRTRLRPPSATRSRNNAQRLSIRQSHHGRLPWAQQMARRHDFFKQNAFWSRTVDPTQDALLYNVRRSQGLTHDSTWRWINGFDYVLNPIRPFSKYPPPNGDQPCREQFWQSLLSSLRRFTHHSLCQRHVRLRRHVSKNARLIKTNYRARRQAHVSFNAKKTIGAFAVKKGDLAGYRLNSKGYSPSPEPTRAIREFPRPADKTDLRSFNGLCQQVGLFSNKIAEALASFSLAFFRLKSLQSVFGYIMISWSI